MENFPNRIKQLREAKGFTQKELSEMLGMKTYTTITKWEAGENFPKGKDVKRLAEIFSVTSDFLLGLEPESSSTLTEINKVSSQLEVPRQKIVLDTASIQLEEQKEEENKIVSIKKEPVDLAELVDESKVNWDEWVSFNGEPLTDEVKEVMKSVLGKRLED